MRPTHSLRFRAYILLAFVAAYVSLTSAASTGWQPAASMLESRTDAAGVVLDHGYVLIMGGRGADGVPLASTEMFNTSSFFEAAPMNIARSRHAAVLLNDGRVLVTGGVTPNGVTASAEVYDPSTEAWTVVGSMTEARAGHTATMLADGRVLIAGGETAGGAASATLETFDPATSAFTYVGTLTTPRKGHAAAILLDKRVLITGGSNGSATLNSTDIFDPSDNSDIPGPLLSVPRTGHIAMQLPDGRVLIAGGSDGATVLGSAETYDSRTGVMASVGATMTTPRSDSVALRLPDNGSVLFVGGVSASGITSATELFVPGEDRFVDVGPLSIGRRGAVAVPVLNGPAVYVAGGGSAAGETLAFPTVTTDKPDYKPGETVTITGSGWQPGESITLTFHETPTTHAVVTLSAVADSTGHFTNTQYAPEPHDVGVAYRLTATGNQSPLEAQAWFMDHLYSFYISSPTSSSPAYSNTPGSVAAYVSYNSPAYTECGSVSTWLELELLNSSGSAVSIWNSYVSSGSYGNWYTLNVPSGLAPGSYTVYGYISVVDYHQVWVSTWTGGYWTCNVSATEEHASYTQPYSVVVKAPTSMSVSSAAATYGGVVSLQASLSSYGYPVPNKTVSFSLNGASVGSALTNASGIAQVNASLGTIAAGTYYPTSAGVAATFAGDNSYTGSTGYNVLSVAKASQTITFGALPDRTVGDPAFTLSATASSGLPVSFSVVSGPATVSGSTVTVTGAGAVTIRATQAGDGNYNAATPVDQSFTVNKITTATALSSSLNPSTYPDSVTFTAKVTSPASWVAGRIARWKLDDATGSTSAADSVGSNTGICGTTVDIGSGQSRTPACPQFGVTGALQTAAQFDGSSTFLRVSNTIGDNFTVSAWIKTTQAGTGTAAFEGIGIIWSDIGGLTNDMIPLALTSGGRVAFGTGESNGGVYDTLTSPGAVNTGQWVHVVVTRDASTGAKQMFIDGALVGSSTGSTGTLNANAMIGIGANALDNRYFNGAIDDVQFFDRVLDASEIQNLANDAPTGTVTFTDNGAQIGTGQVVDGAASFTTTSLAIATHPIVAKYSGDSSYGASASSELDQVVTQAKSTTLLVSSLSPSTYGEPVTFTANVAAIDSAAGVPTGTVVFSSDGTVLGSVALAGGQATITTAALTAGTHAITAEYGGDATFVASSMGLSQPVNKAYARVVVNGYAGPYDGNPHAATGSATGVNGEDLSALLMIGPTFTDAPGGTANWSFAGDDNYNSATGTAEISITKVDATITVTGYTGVYDGNAHGATGSAKGVKGEDLTSLLNLGASFTDVPGGTATWTFAGNTNYNSATGTAAIALTKANATIAVQGYTGIYDGNAHGATGSAKGVKGEDLTSLLNLGASFTDVPGGTATWTFAGNTNYNSATGTAAIALTKADAAIAVQGYTGIYDGNAHGATGSAKGVKGEDLTSLLNLGASFTDVPGGTATWTFAGNTNYNSATGTAAIALTKANATIAVQGYTGIYDAAAHGASGTASGVKGESLNSLLHLGATFTTVPGGTANWTFDGNVNYNAAAGSVAIVINAKPATVAANNLSKTYGQALTFLGTEFVASGFIGGDGLTGVTLTSGGSVFNAGAGTYPIVPSAAQGRGLGNYAITYVPGILTVNPAPLTVTADNKTKLLGATLPAFTASYGGLVAGDTPAALGGTLTFTTPATAASPVGTYPITPGGLTSNNYVITFVNGVLDVTFNVCAQYDSTRLYQSGSTIPIRLQVCDASGANAGGSSITITATNLTLASTQASGAVQSAGNANPDGNFRLVGPPASYLFNLKTTGLSTGTYNLIFTATGDPESHAVSVNIR